MRYVTNGKQNASASRVVTCILLASRPHASMAEMCGPNRAAEQAEFGPASKTDPSCCLELLNKTKATTFTKGTHHTIIKLTY